MGRVASVDRQSITVLRELLRDGSDDDLARFLENFSRAEIASFLIGSMTPEARRVAIAALVEQYGPEVAPTTSN